MDKQHSAFTELNNSIDSKILVDRDIFNYILTQYYNSSFSHDNNPIGFDRMQKCLKDANIDDSNLIQKAYEHIQKTKENEMNSDDEKDIILDTFTLSAYIITNTPGVLKQVNMNKFPINTVTKYACATGKGNETIAQPLNPAYVCQKLGISQQILKHLQSKYVVIAGGAAMYLGCPSSKWDLSCDIDIFVLYSVSMESLHIITKIVQTLQEEGYIVCKYGPSVLTAIGEYGRRRIQIIFSLAESPHELIVNFDLNTVRAYYDGAFLHSTYSANSDWQQMKCSNGLTKPIKARRLARIYLKGFDLDENAKTYLKNTIGWPIPDDIKEKMLYNIPYITPNVPLRIQHQILKQMGMTPVPNLISDNSDNSKVIPQYIDLAPLVNSYGAVDIYTNISMEDYIKTVKLVNSHPCTKGSTEMFDIYPINSKYLINLPICTVPFSWCADKGNNGIRINKITIRDNLDKEKFHKWHDSIIHNLFPNSKHYDSSKEKYPDIRIEVTNHCSMWKNGIKHDGLIDINAGDTVRAIGKVKHITHLKTKSKYYIKFDLTKMYISTTPLVNM